MKGREVRAILVGAMAIAMVVGPCGVCGAVVTYEVVDLGPGLAYGINDLGQVVGGGPGGAFVWQQGSGMRSLGPLVGIRDDGTYGIIEDRYTTASGINNSGVIVGSSHASGEEDHWFICDSNCSDCMLDMGPGGWPHINNPDQSGRFQVVSTFGNRACIWDWDEGIWKNLGGSVLGDPDCTSSYASDINDLGQVVGEASFSGGSGYPFLYWPDGESDLVGNGLGEAYAINNHGGITGSVDTGAYTRACFWQDWSQAPQIWNQWSWGCGINDLGQVVVGDYVFTQAAVLTYGHWKALPPLGSGNWTGFIRAMPEAINNGSDEYSLGQVVGCCEVQGEEFPEVFQHAVLWNPTPEPSAVLVLGTGLLGLAGVLSRRRGR